MATSNLELLRDESGESAFHQREFKGRLKTAGRAATPAAASDSMGMEMSFGMGGAISGGGGRASALKSSRSSNRLGDVEFQLNEESEIIDRVKQIGSKTFFLRDGRYVDADATKEQIDGAIEIEQFTDKYFDLLKDLDEDSKVYFAEQTQVLVVLKDKAYLILPPKPQK
jgi:hypothetical protein